MNIDHHFQTIKLNYKKWINILAVDFQTTMNLWWPLPFCSHSDWDPRPCVADCQQGLCRKPWLGLHLVMCQQLSDIWNTETLLWFRNPLLSILLLGIHHKKTSYLPVFIKLKKERPFPSTIYTLQIHFKKLWKRTFMSLIFSLIEILNNNREIKWISTKRALKYMVHGKRLKLLSSTCCWSLTPQLVTRGQWRASKWLTGRSGILYKWHPGLCIL